MRGGLAQSMRLALFIALVWQWPSSDAHADVTPHGPADEVDSVDSTAVARAPARTARHSLLFAGSFNAEDGNIGMTYRFYLFPEQEVALFAAMTARFWDEVIRVPFRPGVLLQVRETRELWMAGIHKSIGGHGPIGGFADIGAGYTTANYDGVSLDPEEGWTLFLRSGAILSLRTDALVGESWRLELGYQYADLRSAPENWLYGALGAVF